MEIYSQNHSYKIAAPCDDYQIYTVNEYNIWHGNAIKKFTSLFFHNAQKSICNYPFPI